MAKATIQYVCSSCGAKAPQMLGRCPVCGEWGTYEEEVIEKGRGVEVSRTRNLGSNLPQRLQDVVATNEMRIDMCNGELNRVLGGGLVPGSLVLLGGEPGIGKSTLALQVLMQMGERKTFYASGEESAKQLKLRAERLAGNAENLYISAETSLERILEQVKALEPEIVVIDSIQTIGTDAIDASIGSLSQVRECAARILDFAKTRNVPFIIGFAGWTQSAGTYRGYRPAVRGRSAVYVPYLACTEEPFRFNRRVGYLRDATGRFA